MEPYGYHCGAATAAFIHQKPSKGWSGFATWRWQGRRARQRHIRAKKEQNISTRFEGYSAKDVDVDTISKAKHIPSIEEVLAQLDQEDEDEMDECLY